jgi:hypothetical protein
MKSKIAILAYVLLFTFGNIKAQDVTTVTVKSSDISDNLDLEAVASIFGEAENLEDFERTLNDPGLKISNLDLNKDGVVDYLRVMETSSGSIHLVTIQAVLGEDLFQDVATIDVVKDNEGNTQVRVVGDVYMYGPDYVIVPAYVHRPRIVVWFWGPYYDPWYSPYHYGYYPPYYRPWNPYPAYKYRRNVVVHKNENVSYRRAIVKRNPTLEKLQNKTRRNDLEVRNPNNSFTKRNTGIKNRQELIQKRTPESIERPKPNRTRESLKEQPNDSRRPNIEGKRQNNNIRKKVNETPNSSDKSNTKNLKQNNKKRNAREKEVRK